VTVQFLIIKMYCKKVYILRISNIKILSFPHRINKNIYIYINKKNNYVEKYISIFLNSLKINIYIFICNFNIVFWYIVEKKAKQKKTKQKQNKKKIYNRSKINYFIRDVIMFKYIYFFFYLFIYLFLILNNNFNTFIIKYIN